MRAVRFPGPLWNKIISEGTFWLLEESGILAVNEPFEIQTPPGAPWRKAVVKEVSGSVWDGARPKRGPCRKYTFSLS